MSLRIVAGSDRSGGIDDEAGDRLTPRETLFVDEVASGKTLGDAATALGMSARSARRWRTKPHIAAAIRARVAENVGSARAILAAGATRAAAALVNMSDGTVPAEAAKVSAARAVVEAATQAVEADVIEARLVELETRLQERAGQSWRNES